VVIVVAVEAEADAVVAVVVAVLVVVVTPGSTGFPIGVPPDLNGHTKPFARLAEYSV
jgi:hypothetical protein